MACLLPASFAAQGMAADDPLARPEFDQEITLVGKDIDVGKFFMTISRGLGVPITVELEPDPSLKLTMDARHMVCRALFASIASTYGLEYVAGDGGIVVRRRGAAPAPTGPGYRLDMLVRDAKGRVLERPTLSVRGGAVGVLRVGLGDGRAVTVLDRAHSASGIQHIGGLEIAIGVKGEVAGGLELLTEVIVRRPTGEARYTEDHAFATRTAAAGGETVLGETTNGDQVALASWRRAEE
jgi:hypothetical protein